jgi:hypothetical protein
MPAELTVIEVLRVIFLGLSPVIFLIGLFILLINPEKYNKLETNLGKEIGGIRKRIIPAIETNISVLHNWLMKKRTIVGLLCIVCAVIFFSLLRK